MDTNPTIKSTANHAFPQDVVEIRPGQCACGNPINPAEVAMRLHEETGHLCLDCYGSLRIAEASA
jgi:hypothetical protein